MSVLRISRLAVAGILAIGMSFLLAPTALAQYGGGPSGSVTVTVGQDVVVSFPAGSGFLPNEVVDGVLQPNGNVSGASYVPKSPSGTSGHFSNVALSVAPAAFTPRLAQTVTAKGRAGADGSVSVTFPTTGLRPGPYTATVTGETSRHSASALVTVLPVVAAVGGVAAGSNAPTAPGTDSGLLAFTGANAVAPLAIGGVALLVVGAGAVLFTRKRKVDA